MEARAGQQKRLSAKELMPSNCGTGEDSWESLGQQGDQTSKSERKSVPNIHWKDSCWNWSSNTLEIWCEERLIGKDPDAGKDWRQEEKRTTEEEMVDSITNSMDVRLSKLWEKTGKPDVLQSTGLQSRTRVSNRTTVTVRAGMLSCFSRVWLSATRDSAARNTGMGCCALFQGIFLTQGANWCLLGLLHWQAGSLPLAPPGKPHSNSRIL